MESIIYGVGIACPLYAGTAVPFGPTTLEFGAGIGLPNTDDPEDTDVPTCGTEVLPLHLLE